MTSAIKQRFFNSATYRQKVWATSVSNGDHSGEATLGQWPQCYRVWNEIDTFQISDNIVNYVLNQHCNRL
jgi:hypothetical protein